MIRKEELRIGNWFEWSDYSSIGKGFDYIKIPEEIGIYNELKNPIPLSPEILKKANFDKRSSSNEYWTHWQLPDGFYISEAHHSQSEGGVVKGGFYWGYEFLHIESFHHLQNFYYYYTSMKKEIKL